MVKIFNLEEFNMESRSYTLISVKDVQEMKQNPKNKSLEDFLEDSLKKLPGTIRDVEFHKDLDLLEVTMGEEDFERLQALTKKRYEALVALERNREEGQGKKDAEALWDAYKTERNHILRFAANGARHSLGQFPINKTTVGDMVREADLRLQKYAENGFKQAKGTELAELLTFQRSEKNVSLAQWFKKVFNTIFVYEPRQAVEFKQLPPLKISESQASQVSSSEAKVMQLLSSDHGLAVNLQLEVYEKIGPKQAGQVADLKKDKDRYQLAADIQQQELDFYKQEMENLKLTQKFLDEEEKGNNLRR